MQDEPLLQKTLTPNDVGATGSHQAGIHVPHGLTWFFPTLDSQRLNPGAWLEIAGEAGTYRWRWIHYNNGVVSDGTRDEYRLTRTRSFLRDHSAREGDTLELVHRDGHAYRATTRPRPQAGVLILSSAGAWRSVTVKA